MAEQIETVKERDRFERLAGEWQRQSMHCSSSYHAMEQPAYVEIANMNVPVPWLFDRYARDGMHFWCGVIYDRIGKDGPEVPEEHRGRTKELRRIFREFAEARGYIDNYHEGAHP